MTPSVSVVIATLGRPTLDRAIRSVLTQSLPVGELIVVLDADVPVSMPDDDRITVVHSRIGDGAAHCRQIGVETARGSVIALLDDDDQWLPDKLERQLAEVPAGDGEEWIVTSRMDVHGPGDRHRTWPRRLIEPGQSVADYLFRVGEIGVGGAVLQTSTLVFPTALAKRVRWDTHPGTVHDEESWLLEVQRAVPDVRLVHVSDVLSVYDVTQASVSRDHADRTGDYIAWGLNYLQDESSRLRGDYLCSKPVSAAVSAGSIRGVMRAVRAALGNGRPGPFALAYAALSAVRILVARIGSAARR